MEGFFRFCGALGQNELSIEEILLHRYGNAIEYIYKKKPCDGIKFITKAIDENRDDRLYQWWVQLVPNMTKKTFISFESFRDQLTGANLDKRSAEEIVAEALEIEERLKNGS